MMKVFAFLVLSLILGCFNNAYCISTPSSEEEVFIKVDSLEAISKHTEANTLLKNYINKQLRLPYPHKHGIINAYIRKGNIYRITNQSAKSTESFNNALLYAITVDDLPLIALSNRELGYNHVMSGRYDEGLDAYSKALEIDTKFEDWVNVSVCLNAIGKIYEMWREFDKALEFYYKSLEISEKHGYLNQVAVRQASLASVYKSLGKFDKALERLDKSLQLEKKLDNKIRKGYRLDQIGEIHTMKGDFDLAEDYLVRALKIFQENNVLVSKSIVLNHIGLNYLKKNDYENAEAYYNNSLEIAKSIGFNNMIQKNYEELSLLNQKRGNFYLALENYKRFIDVRDSAYNERARQQLLDFQVKYETEQKEKELAVLNQVKLEQELELNKSRQQRIVMIGVSIVLLILLGALLSRYYVKKRAQKQLQFVNSQLNEINQTKDKFFNILAHDLKNPIYAFRNISTAVHDNYNELKLEEINYYTEELKNSSTKLSAFLDELLKWAASQTGRMAPQPKSVSAKMLFSELHDLLLPMIKNKNIEFRIDVPEAHLFYADKNMMHTVFRNLLTNAIKFTPEKGVVSVESSLENSSMIIKVSDNGIGISEEDAQKLFDIGSDASKIGDSKEKGSGLGLILAKEFVHKNNGNISVRSTLGEGSTFEISLPVNQNGY